MEFAMEVQKRQLGELLEGFIPTLLSRYEGMKEEPVYREGDEATIRRLRERGIPREGRPVRQVFEEMEKEVYANQTLVQHPRCFACIPSPVSLFSWMGEVMTSGYDPHAGCWINASTASCIEQEVIRWMCSLAGYPHTGSGLFVSGGSMANLTALTAARDKLLPQEDRARGVAYVSEQTHSSVAKGLHILGFAPQQVRVIPTDELFRMRVDRLEEAIREDRAAGRKPFAVIATAGTTNTGSIDPLEEIGSLCEREGLWMHVDGAYGASLLVSEEQREKLRGIERSNSISWDAHKWLMQTYGCSAVLVRDGQDLVHSFAVHPEYLEDAVIQEGQLNYWDLGPELTRPARSLKLWATLQVMGTDRMGQAIDHGCAMARLAEESLRRCPGWEIVCPAQQAIVNFRYAPAGVEEGALDGLNQRIAQAVTASGYAQILTTQLKGKKVLRICCPNPETTEEDIRTTIQLLDRLARELTQERIA